MDRIDAVSDALDRCRGHVRAARWRSAALELDRAGELLDDERGELVAAMRRRDCTWRQVGQALDVDHAAAYRRYRTRCRPAASSEPAPPAVVVPAQRDYAGYWPHLRAGVALRHQVADDSSCWCGEPAPDLYGPEYFPWARTHRDHLPADHVAAA